MIPSFEQRHSRGGRACPQFGGGGGSSNSTTKTENKDSRISQQSGTAVSGDSNTVNVLDGGAIKNAFDFGTSTVTQSLGFAAASQGQVLDSLKTTSQLVANAYNDAKGRGAMTDYILIGSVAMAGLVALMALRK